MINKSLLTPEDIRNFIYETVQKVHPRTDVMYCPKHLEKILNMSRYFIKKYTKQGMPYVKYNKVKRYNINKVIEWLNENNIPYSVNEG